LKGSFIIRIIFLKTIKYYYGHKIDDYLRRDMAETTKHFHKWLEFGNNNLSQAVEMAVSRSSLNDAAELPNTALRKIAAQKWLHAVLMQLTSSLASLLDLPIWTISLVD